MEKAITVKEVLKAIDKVKRNKAPGPDGIIAEIYKIYKEELVLHLLVLFRQCKDEGIIPGSWKEAKILIIPKVEKDSQLVESLIGQYLLLNIDYKILATIMADRLHSVFSDIVYLDQVGFVRNRYVQGNIRKVVNVIERAKRMKLAVVLF